MQILVLQGSPRKMGNTKQFSQACIDRLREKGMVVNEIWLQDKRVNPCLECFACQNVLGSYGCVQQDDMQELFDAVQKADLLLFSVPIFAGFAPGPVKTFMDRLIYGSAKNYGDQKAPSLLEGKKCAILLTSGRKPETMLPGFEFAVRALCKHLSMNYIGWAGATDPGRSYTFMNEKKKLRAEAFADTMIEALS